MFIMLYVSYISIKMGKNQAGVQKNQIKYIGDRCMGEEGRKQAENCNTKIITNQLTHGSIFGGQGHGDGVR